MIVESFANGLDLRKSHDTAPPGSLRVLRNAIINGGGEIEKVKAFYREPTLTAYGQMVDYKGRITGPHRAEVTAEGRYFYRHRHNSLPSTGWTAGTGTEAVSMQVGTMRPATIYAMKSTTPLTNFGSMFRANAVAYYADKVHIIESFRANAPTTLDNQHIEVTLSAAGEPTSQDVITANDNCTNLAVFRSKGYVAEYKTFKISATFDPGDMAGAGSGAQDVRTQGRPPGRIMGFAEYYGELCVVGQRAVQFWQMDADPAQNQYIRSSPVAVASERSLIGYGDGDVVYLGTDGIRALSARDSSNVATLLDIGSPIDSLVQAFTQEDTAAEMTDGEMLRHSAFIFTHPSVLHPITGQLWMFLGSQIFVYCNHPGAKVKAWVALDMPQVAPGNINPRNGIVKSGWCADVCQFGNDIMFRNYADETYIYGGPDGSTYDHTEVEVITPHMDMGRPGTEKHFTGIDLACSGEWRIEVSLDPTCIVWETIAIVGDSSHRLTGKIAMDLRGYHIAIRATCTSDMAAKLGQIVIYHDVEDEK